MRQIFGYSTRLIHFFISPLGHPRILYIYNLLILLSFRLTAGVNRLAIAMLHQRRLTYFLWEFSEASSFLHHASDLGLTPGLGVD